MKRDYKVNCKQHILLPINIIRLLRKRQPFFRMSTFNQQITDSFEMRAITKEKVKI